MAQFSTLFRFKMSNATLSLHYKNTEALVININIIKYIFVASEGLFLTEALKKRSKFLFRNEW